MTQDMDIERAPASWSEAETRRMPSTPQFRIATAIATADPELGRRVVQHHLAERDHTREAGRKIGRIGTPDGRRAMTLNGESIGPLHLAACGEEPPAVTGPRRKRHR
ncbi:hypothetical protein [Curtobacterium flaccumfaciens]|uniref:hypothetical protein n=1 Tax=Curtobacterium flaccumfaciens TaxID=2035 RepID=UPI001AD9FF33|nr:hypothetical protein [Curtobacterium flaccumfaciens]MBO9049517.1 hypothetical protein [Curtobacterium flaccumfaciens pv. flaccumfaciens]